MPATGETKRKGASRMIQGAKLFLSNRNRSIFFRRFLLRGAFLLILLGILLLPGCSGKASPQDETAGDLFASSSSSADPAPPKAERSDTDRTAQQTIAAYFERQYEAYTGLSEPDVSDLLDLSQPENQNRVVWLQMLTMRRRLLAEHKLCYVETSAYPYSILYEDEPEDERMEFWSSRLPEEGNDAVYHFRIKGEPGRVYPPAFAAGAQHTVFLRETEEGWKITRHYYPGSVRALHLAGRLRLPTEKEMLADLRAEFANGFAPAFQPAPAGALPYQPQKAVSYALRHVEAPNPDFYQVIDWDGNCQNFVSQALSSGFEQKGLIMPMTADWFAGGGGGSPAWENVDHFWTFAVLREGIGGRVIPGVGTMEEGDLLQTRSTGAGDPDDFSHALLLVDRKTLLFAQNTPGALVYYADLVGLQTRAFRPDWLPH